MGRICIYVKDICKITGQSERTAQKILAAMRIHYKKKKHHYFTKNELSRFLGIPADEITLD